MSKINIQLITGVFVIISILSFTYAAVTVGGARFNEAPGYTLHARFTDVSGLRSGAVVEAAGVRVGTVSKVEFDADGFEALVSLRIDEGVPVQEDAIAAVRTQGIIGEKFIKIIPGGFPELLADGDEIYETESAVSIEELISKYIFEG